MTFKCVGVTHHMDAQEALRKVSKLLQEGSKVQVKLFPEPAITFKCNVDGNWVGIGYVVREA